MHIYARVNIYMYMCVCVCVYIYIHIHILMYIFDLLTRTGIRIQNVANGEELYVLSRKR